MNISIETGSYNSRRYGKPWIAVVSFANGAKGEYTWGEWAGQPGEAGILVVEAKVGDVISHGQRDGRGNNSTPQYFIVDEDGSLKSTTKAEAYKHSKVPTTNNPLAQFSNEQIRAELEKREADKHGTQT